MSGVKRYDCTSGGASFCQGCYTMDECELGDYVSHDDYDQLHAANQRLEGEVKRLREALASARVLFPFRADRQKFNFDGREIKADGDNLFFSVKRTEEFLCAVHASLSINGEVE